MREVTLAEAGIGAVGGEGAALLGSGGMDDPKYEKTVRRAGGDRLADDGAWIKDWVCAACADCMARWRAGETLFMAASGESIRGCNNDGRAFCACDALGITAASTVVGHDGGGPREVVRRVGLVPAGRADMPSRRCACEAGGMGDNSASSPCAPSHRAADAAVGAQCDAGMVAGAGLSEPERRCRRRCLPERGDEWEIVVAGSRAAGTARHEPSTSGCGGVTAGTPSTPVIAQLPRTPDSAGDASGSETGAARVSSSSSCGRGGEP